MKKKIVAILFVFVLMLTTFSSAYGVELLNLGVLPGGYGNSFGAVILLPHRKSIIMIQIKSPHFICITL